jgi:transposase-like protein
MQPNAFKRHRFPPAVICYAVWLYYRFTLSIRDVRAGFGSETHVRARPLP